MRYQKIEAIEEEVFRLRTVTLLKNNYALLVELLFSIPNLWIQTFVFHSFIVATSVLMRLVVSPFRKILLSMKFTEADGIFLTKGPLCKKLYYFIYTLYKSDVILDFSGQVITFFLQSPFKLTDI
jgi:hypothetical protein